MPRDVPIARLEPRRLLAADFDGGTGILDLTSGPENAIFQFESTFENGREQFRVLQSAGDAGDLPPPVTDEDFADDLADYLESATDRRTFGPYDVTEVRYVRLRTGSGADLLIAGNRVNVPIEADTAGGDDTLSGGPGADTLVGNLGDDYLFGGGGNDVLTGSADDDRMLGGAGDRDAVDYRANAANAPVNVTIDGVANDGQNLERDYVGFDVEVLVGGNGNDTLDAGTRPAGVMDGDGDRVFLGGVGLYGGPGADLLIGTDQADTLAGDEGNDNLDAGAGDDLLLDPNGDFGSLLAGAGRDTVVADADNADTIGDAEVILRPGDTISAPATDVGRAGIDDAGIVTVEGTDGDDLIRVTADADFLRVLVRPADLTGPGGFEETVDVFELFPEDPAVEIVRGVIVAAGDGDDLVLVDDIAVGGDASAIVSATLLGGSGDDVLFGGAGDDRLDGGDLGTLGTSGRDGRARFGRNYLFGRGGDDTLRSGFGSDLLSGGTGSDTIDYSGRGSDPVRVGLGGLFDDGLPGENDNARSDVETLIGTDGPDDLRTVGSSSVRFVALAGNDTVRGGIGADTIIGGEGRDSLFGNEGGDFFDALDDERDSVSGGQGDDDGRFDTIDVVTFGNDG